MSIQKNQSIPFYIKLSFVLLSILLASYILYQGKEVIIPLLLSALLSIFLLRPVLFLEEKKWCPRPLAIVLPLLVAMAAIGGIVYFIYSQVALFADDAPLLKEKLLEQVNSGQIWIKQYLKISFRDQNEYIDETLGRIKSSGIIGKAFLSLSASLSLIILIPIFTYLLLYYKNHIMKFFTDIFNKNANRVKEVFHESRTIIQNYLTGLVIEMMIVITLNIIGLSLIGIKYAFLLAVLAGVLNLIPYIGMISAAALTMLLTLITSDNPIDVLWVMVTLGSIQFVDNYFILPIVVGSKVQINALATILGVLIGGTLMAVPGMFLSIPSIAVIKVICDRVEILKPWGALLGNGTKPTEKKWWQLKLFRKQDKKVVLHAVHHKKVSA